MYLNDLFEHFDQSSTIPRVSLRKLNHSLRKTNQEQNHLSYLLDGLKYLERIIRFLIPRLNTELRSIFFHSMNNAENSIYSYP